MTTGRGGSGVKYVGLVNGKKQWIARIYWTDEKTGKQCEARRTFFAASKTLAIVRRDEELEKAKSGTEGRASRLRFREAVEEYIPTIATHSTKLSYASRLKRAGKRFDGWYLDAVTRADLQLCLDEDRSANLLRPPLLGLFRFAVRRGYLEANLVKLTDVERKPHQVLEDAPEKALSPQQVTLYFAHLEQHEPELYPLVYVQFCLGCRFAEVSSLRHEDVDLETGLVKIRRGQYRGVEGGTKGKYARRAGLPSSAVELIRRHAQRMSVERWPGWRELVFPRPLSGSRRGSNFWAASTADGKIREAYKRLGFPLAGATTHVARHTLISIANTLEQMPSGLLKTVVGHKTDQVHALYNRPPDENVLALGERLGQALTGSETGSFTKPKRKKPTK